MLPIFELIQLPIEAFEHPDESIVYLLNPLVSNRFEVRLYAFRCQIYWPLLFERCLNFSSFLRDLCLAAS